MVRFISEYVRSRHEDIRTSASIEMSLALQLMPELVGFDIL